MKRKILGAIIATTILLTGCTNTLDKKLNKDDFEQVKQEISSNEMYSEMKKRYLIDNLEMQLGFLALGKAMEMDDSKLPTFREQINELTTDFDSIRTSILEIKKNNKKIENFLTLKDANTNSIDRYKGYLTMTLDFNNQFDKEILYIILNYKYVNKYDTEFFNEKSKLTDEIAEDFKGQVKVSTREEYNRVAEFMYTKVPAETIPDEHGKEKSNEEYKKTFLMEGFKVAVLAIVFKDKSEIVYQDAEWKYFEDEKLD